jgi:transposase
MIGNQFSDCDCMAMGGHAIAVSFRFRSHWGVQLTKIGFSPEGSALRRHLDDHPHLSPRRTTRLLLTRPKNLTERQRERLKGLAAACPEMTALASVVRSFAALLSPHKDNPARLAAWITATRETDLPHVHSFIRGVDQDTHAVIAAITLTHHNGRTEGVNTRTKLLERQMYGRAGIALLRHRILLG